MVQTARQLNLQDPGYFSGRNSESPASAMLHMARAQVSDDDAIRHMQQALKLLDEAQVDGAREWYRADVQAAFWLHYDYAELLRTPVSARDQKSEAQWKREVVSHYRKALAHADKAHKQSDGQLEQSTLTASIQLHIWNTMGLLQLDLDEPHQALSSFQQALLVGPQAVEPIGNVILTLMSLGNMESALNYTLRALKKSPRDPRLLHNVGMLMRQDREDDQAADF